MTVVQFRVRCRIFPLILLWALWSPSGSASAWEASQFQKPDEGTLRQALTTMQYKVTQQGGTEPAFHNEYWENHRHGIYVDVVSGEPLFSSLDKFDSGAGWPSFTKPLAPENINITVRREVRSTHADSHLGDVFLNSPTPTGLRYCIDSAALRFVPAEQLKEAGYGEYVSLFEGPEAPTPAMGK